MIFLMLVLVEVYIIVNLNICKINEFFFKLLFLFVLFLLIFNVYLN